MKHTPDKKPCDCIELLEGVWVQRCDCQNSGDLAAAESWCGDANRGADLREALDALDMVKRSLPVAADVTEPGMSAVAYTDAEWDELVEATKVADAVLRKHGRAV